MTEDIVDAPMLRFAALLVLGPSGCAARFTVGPTLDLSGNVGVEARLTTGLQVPLTEEHSSDVALDGA